MHVESFIITYLCLTDRTSFLSTITHKRNITDIIVTLFDQNHSLLPIEISVNYIGYLLRKHATPQIHIGNYDIGDHRSGGRTYSYHITRNRRFTVNHI